MSMQATTTKYEPTLSQREHVEPKPGPEHDWLQQFVGDGETEVECRIEPGKPPMKAKGTESVRSICGLWIVTEAKICASVTPTQAEGVWRAVNRRNQSKCLKGV